MKALKTNSKQVREEIRQHIIYCVTSEDEQNYDNIQDAANRLYEEFDRVANHEYNKRKFPNDQERFSDYLTGLPFSFEYTYFGIKEYLNSLGINPEGKEYSDEKSQRLYHYLIYSEMMKNKTV